MNRYTLTHRAGSVDFWADSRMLALDHARHLCAVNGWTLLAVERIREAKQ